MVNLQCFYLDLNAVLVHLIVNHIYSIRRNSLGRVIIIVLIEKNLSNYERFVHNFVLLFHFLSRKIYTNSFASVKIAT